MMIQIRPKTLVSVFNKSLNFKLCILLDIGLFGIFKIHEFTKHKIEGWSLVQRCQSGEFEKEDDLYFYLDMKFDFISNVYYLVGNKLQYQNTISNVNGKEELGCIVYFDFKLEVWAKPE